MLSAAPRSARSGSVSSAGGGRPTSRGSTAPTAASGTGAAPAPPPSTVEDGGARVEPYRFRLQARRGGGGASFDDGSEEGFTPPWRCR